MVNSTDKDSSLSRQVANTKGNLEMVYMMAMGSSVGRTAIITGASTRRGRGMVLGR